MSKYAKPVLTVVVAAALGVVIAAPSAFFLPPEWQPGASWLVWSVTLVATGLGSLRTITGYSLLDVFARRRQSANIKLLLLRELEANQERLRDLRRGRVTLIQEASHVGRRSWGLKRPLSGHEYSQFRDHGVVLSFPSYIVDRFRQYYSALEIMNRQFPSLSPGERSVIAREFIGALREARQLGAQLIGFLREPPLTRADLWLLIGAAGLLVADTATVTAITASLWAVVPPPPNVVPEILGCSALLVVCGSCLLAFLGVRRFAALPVRLRLASLGAITGLLLMTLAGAIGWAVWQLQPPQDIIVLVTAIQGPEPERYRISENILGNLREGLSNTKNVRIEYRPQGVSEAEGSEAARALGTRPLGSRNDATIVIWGWYAPSPTHVQVEVHFELLRQPLSIARVDIDTGKARTYAITELDSFSLQVELSEEMTLLTALVAGMAHYEMQNYEAAEQSLTIAVSQVEASAGSSARQPALFYRAYARYAQGLYAAAITDLNEVIRVDPTFDVAYNNRGAAHAHLGQYEHAIADLNEAIRLDPHYSWPHYNRGFVCHVLGDYEQAITDYTEAIRLDPRHAWAWCNRGVAHAELGQYEEAIADLTETVRLDPNDAWAYDNRGLAHYYLGEYQQAVADFTQAVRVDPNLACAYSNRGSAYVRLGQYQQAIVDLTRAIRLDRNLASAYYNRGLAHRKLGQYQEAIIDFQSYLQLAPPDDEPYRRRSEQYIDQMREQQ